MASLNYKNIFVLTLMIFFLFILLISSTASTSPKNQKNTPKTKPCKTLTFYFHDILNDGTNSHNATSAIVASPAWARSKLTFSGPTRFGDLIVFDNPITVQKDLRSKPIGRAQGFYSYNGKSVLSAWFSVSFVFRSKEVNGTLNLAGADTMMEPTRDVSIVGGTGEFFMARGTATITTDTYEEPTYFRLRFDVKLYECGWVV